jgi:hypothetical protein
MAWQRIDTAPKTGEPILLWCPEGVDRPGYAKPPEGLACVALGWWGASNDSYRPPDRWISADVECDTFSGSEYTGAWTEYEWVCVEPTHWMPIPEAPVAGG